MKIEQSVISGKEDREGLPTPLRIVSEFYAAFNSRDLDAISQNWSRTEDVVADSPAGGITRGWQESESIYRRIFSSPVQVYAEFYDYSLHEGKEMFYVIGRERVELRAGGEVVNVNVRISRFYRMIGGRWQQVHLHGSIDDPEQLTQYQRATRAIRHYRKVIVSNEL